MTEAPEDPMDGAAIGETRTVRVSDEVEPWFRSAVDPMIGSDRDCGPLDLVDVELVGEPGNERIELEYEADVTKRLPRNWDRPLAEHPKHRRRSRSRRRTWKDRVLGVAAIFLPMGVVFGVGIAILRLSREPMMYTSEGEPVAFSLDPASVLSIGVLMFAIAVIVYLGTRGYFPRRRGGRAV